MSGVREIRVRLDLEGEVHDVGLLALIEGRVYFEYATEFLQTGLQLSPFRLPLKDGAVFNADGMFEGLFGLFNDSLPDGWGRLLVDRHLRKNGVTPERITPLDRLSYTGLDGMGALDYIPDLSSSMYAAYDDVIDLDRLDDDMRKVLEGSSEDVLKGLIALNGSSAGARPKALLQVSSDKKSLRYGEEGLLTGFEHWLLKFANSGDSRYGGNIEYAYSLMAKEAGLVVEKTHLFEGRSGKSYFGTRRFDREGDDRLHVHTLCGLVHSDFRIPSLDYDDLLSVTGALTKDVNEVEKAFRLACFNVLSHNRDDHEKNVSFTMDRTGIWKMTPAYDLTFSSGPNGWQSLTVMGEGVSPGIKELVRLAKSHDVKEYKDIIDEVTAAVSIWSQFADQARVPQKEASLIEKVLTKR